MVSTHNDVWRWGSHTVIWGCSSINGTEALHIIERNVNGAMYQDILEKNWPIN